MQDARGPNKEENHLINGITDTGFLEEQVNHVGYVEQK
jgi:hypothetical protein